MRFLKQAVLMCSLLMSALALLAIVSLRNLPAQTGRGGGVNVPSRNGDVDCDGQLTITDPIVLLNYLFLDGAEPCAAAQEDPGCCKEIVAKLDQIANALVDPCKDPARRLKSSGDGIGIDLCTGLMWQGDPVSADVDLDGSPDNRFNWNQSVNLAAASRAGGYSDWRVPNAKELESLVRLIAERPYRSLWIPDLGMNIGLQGVWFWSSSEFALSGYANVANLHPDQLALDIRGKQEKLALILVRGVPLE